MANSIDPAYERFLELKSEIQAALKAKPNESENKALSGIAKLKKRGRSTLMVTSLDRSGRWETQAQIDACLAETGVTKDQVVRWGGQFLALSATSRLLAVVGHAALPAPSAVANTGAGLWSISDP
jgi:hypothetical protein